MNEPVTIDVTAAERLDTFLAEHLGQSRNQIAQLIKGGHVRVDAEVQTKPGLKLKAGQSLHVSIPQVTPHVAQSIDFDVTVLYEDASILIIDKPSDLTVHAAPSVKEPTLVDWLIHKGISLSTISGEERHGIVHRLDKGTSGVMVVAKTNEAHEKLSQQLQDKSMGRYYLALVTPPLKEHHTVIEAPVGRSSHNRLKMAAVPEGKSAKTLFCALSRSRDGKEELIGAKLFTGRTHQIRVHLETISRHILGDHLYGVKSKEDKISRILLHAYVMYLTHPQSGERMQFYADIPQAMRDHLQKYFDQEPLDALLSPDTFSRHFDQPDLY
ncbi:MAG: RluA family pseudouridine synthase [Campylobacterales bacterium]|nr:RluA family pseudouridine synthase [Campylobacterales bacterium]